MRNEFEQDHFDSSWIPIFIMLAVFWPVGLFMLFSKLKNMEKAGDFRRRRWPINTIAILLLLSGALNMFGGGFIPRAFMLLGGAALFVVGNATRRQERRFKKYRAVIGARPYMSITEIAKAMPVPFETAKDDLQKMIDAGMFGQSAFLDMRSACFVVDARYAPRAERVNAAPKQARPAPVQAAAEPAREQPKKPDEPASGESQLAREFSAKLQEIRKANEAIDHEKISDQIDRIEEITASIFDLVYTNPQKLSEIHTFMNYYLPTTLKLLKTYAQLEKQPVESESIRSSKAEIEALMDQLVWAFEQQLEQVFKTEAMDISSDIKVMEQMLAKDGLSGNGSKLPRNPFQKPASGGPAAQAAQEEK